MVNAESSSDHVFEVTANYVTIEEFQRAKEKNDGMVLRDACLCGAGKTQAPPYSYPDTLPDTLILRYGAGILHYGASKFLSCPDR